MFPRLIVVRFFLGGLSSSNGGSQGREDKPMTKNEKNETVNHAPLNYPHPCFVPIEDDGMAGTLRFYRDNKVPYKDITLSGQQKRYFAIVDAETEEKAKSMNRNLDSAAKKEARGKAKSQKNETSYDALRDSGFDPTDDSNDPEKIVMHKILLDALYRELDDLSAEKLRIVRMIANNEPQQQVADELDIPRRTLRDHTEKLLTELRKKLKPYR
jgi:DNA-binding CsgD family transcriptional regulator